MSSGASPSISEKAALTILLHAAKYPAAAVNGVLLGQADPSKGILQITAAVPLLHSFLSLAPSLETALYLVRCTWPTIRVTIYAVGAGDTCFGHRLTPTPASLPQI